MSDKLLIVGGTGFIGEKLARYSEELGFSVTVLSLKKPKINIDRVEYIQCDIADRSKLQKKLFNNSFDYVVNLSGYIDHSDFLEGGKSVINVHFNGVQNLLEIINWNTLKRYVQIGSSDEYGNLSAPQHESMREAPISPYSLGKVSSTHFLQMLYRIHNLPIVILRLFLVYGPGQNHSRFFPQIINGCLNRKKFPVSEGLQLRDFCYIDDVLKAIMLTLANDNVNGEVINIASGKSISIRHTIEMIKKNIGYGEPCFGEISYRSGENMELVANISKANNLLNWTPLVTIEEGIQRTIDSFIENEF